MYEAFKQDVAPHASGKSTVTLTHKIGTRISFEVQRAHTITGEPFSEEELTELMRGKPMRITFTTE